MNKNSLNIFIGLVITFVIILLFGLGGVYFTLKNRNVKNKAETEVSPVEITKNGNSLTTKIVEKMEKINEEDLNDEIGYNSETGISDMESIDAYLFFASYGDEIEENASLMPDGEYIEYYEDGKMRSKGNYKNRKLEGEWVSYHENGKVWEKRNYKNGKRDGNWRVYTVEGLVLLNENYTNGLRNGEFIWRVPKNSKYEIDDTDLTPNLVVASYNRGDLEYYNSESEISSEIDKIDGKGNYEEINYYQNGNIASKNSYRNKKLEGQYETYYENGIIMERGNYKNGKLDGEYSSYYEDGSIEKKENYKNGELYGEYILYDNNGNIQKKGNYLNEQESVELDSNKKSTDNNSEVGERKETEGKNIVYFPNGKILKEYSLKNGELHGEYIEYYENGEVLIKGVLKNGLQLGRWEIYDEDGELFVVEYYRDGIKMK